MPRAPGRRAQLRRDGRCARRRPRLGRHVARPRRASLQSSLRRPTRRYVRPVASSSQVLAPVADLGTLGRVARSTGPERKMEMTTETMRRACPVGYDEGTLRAYLDGELEREGSESLQVHAKGCAACSERLMKLRLDGALVQG